MHITMLGSELIKRLNVKTFAIIALRFIMSFKTILNPNYIDSDELNHKLAHENCIVGEIVNHDE